MPKPQFIQDSFRLGLQTDHVTDGLPFGGFDKFEDASLDKGGIKARKRLCYLDRAAADDALNLVFDGSANYIDIPLHDIHTLGTVWTFECLFSPDIVTGTEYVWGVNHASDYSIRVRRATTGIEVDVQDSAAVVTTLTGTTTYSGGETVGLQVVRDGTSLTLRINGVSQDTDTMSALTCKAPGGDVRIGNDNASGEEFEGQMDYVRCFSVARTHHRDWQMRWLDPRGDDVLWDYFVQADSNKRVLDRSKYQNTGLLAGSKSETSGVLSHRSSAGQAIAPYRTRANEPRLFYAAGGIAYAVEV